MNVCEKNDNKFESYSVFELRNSIRVSLAQLSQLNVARSTVNRKVLVQAQLGTSHFEYVNSLKQKKI